MKSLATMVMAYPAVLSFSSCESVVDIPRPTSYYTPGPAPEVVMKEKMNLPKEESGIVIRKVKLAIAEFADPAMFRGEHFSFNLLYSHGSRCYVWEVSEGAHGVFTVRFAKRLGVWTILSVDGAYDGIVQLTK